MKAKQIARASGKIKYTTGKPCRNGHLSERLVSSGRCIECSRADNKKHKRLKKYGVTQSKYFELFWKQNGKCAICREAETIINYLTYEPVALAIDHCHETGKIRGLLCTRCNVGIGNLKHDPQLLRIAALYCEKD